MSRDDRSPHAMIAELLEQCLAAIADDRGCSTDDLSFRLYRALETYGLECFRLGQEQLTGARSGQSGVMPRAQVDGVVSASATRPRTRRA